MSEVSSLPWADAPAVASSTGNAIGLYAKWTPALDAKIEAALQRLTQANIDHGDGLVQSSSLGVEDMVITDLAVFERSKRGSEPFRLIEMAPGVTIDHLRSVTEATFVAA